MNEKKRIVRLSNDIAQKANDDMTLPARKIAYAVIEESIATNSDEICLTSNQLIKKLEWTNGGKSYRILKDELNDLISKCKLRFEDSESTIVDNDGNKPWKTLMMFSSVEGIGNDYYFVLNPAFVDHINKNKNFYNFQLKILNRLTTPYSAKLYEYLSSRRNEFKTYGRHPIATLHQLRLKLLSDTTIYKEWSRFKDNILNPAIKIINKQTDLIINYETIKEKGKVANIKFFITEKKQVEDAETIETNSANSIEEDLSAYHDSNGCKLNGYEEKILLEIVASHKRAELARYKKDMPEKYSFYTKKGEYSDFHAILMFVKNDVDEFIGQDINTIEQMKRAFNELGLEKYVICVRLVQKAEEKLTYDNVLRKSQERQDVMDLLEKSKEKPGRKRKKKTAPKPKKEEIKQEETDVQEISADDLPW